MNIRRLADHLNISIGTVSRALNNRPGVHPETLEKVLKAATELGYVANQSGRSLRRGATNTIGFVIETGHPAHQAGDQFFYVVLDAMNLYLAEQRYDLVVLPCHSADDPVEFLSRVIARGIVDALVMTATRRVDHRIAQLAKSKLPFMTLGRSETPGNYSWIDLDFEGVARRSVEEVVKLGHRRIAVGLPDNDVALGYHYKAGYLKGLAEAGIAVDESLIIRVPTSELGASASATGGRHGGSADRAAALLGSDRRRRLCGLRRNGRRGWPRHFHRRLPRKSADALPQSRARLFRLDLDALGTRLGETVLDLMSPDEEISRRRGEIVPLSFRARQIASAAARRVLTGRIGPDRSGNIRLRHLRQSLVNGGLHCHCCVHHKDDRLLWRATGEVAGEFIDGNDGIVWERKALAGPLLDGAGLLDQSRCAPLQRIDEGGRHASLPDPQPKPFRGRGARAANSSRICLIGMSWPISTTRLCRSPLGQRSS